MELHQIFANAGMAGVVVWILWWMMTKQIPAMNKAHEASTSKQRRDFLDMLKGTLEEFSAVLKENTDTVRQVNETMLVHDRAFQDRGIAACVAHEEDNDGS